MMDKVIAAYIEEELERQSNGLEMIASENFASMEVIRTMGTILTNKYAEGYPGKRYYGGCFVVDKIEQLAIDRAKELLRQNMPMFSPIVVLMLIWLYF